MAPSPSSVKPSQGYGTQHSPQDRAYMPSDRVVGQCGQEPKNYSSTSKSGLFKPNMSVYKPLSSQKGRKKNHDVGKRGRSCPPVRWRFFTTYLHGVPFWTFQISTGKQLPWGADTQRDNQHTQNKGQQLCCKVENSNSLIQEGWDPRKGPWRILLDVNVDCLEVHLYQQLEVLSNRREAQSQELAVQWLHGMATYKSFPLSFLEGQVQGRRNGSG